MANLQQLVIAGAGGCGIELVSAIECINALKPTFELLGFCDDDKSKQGSVIEGIPVLGPAEEIDHKLSIRPKFICAIGNNLIRREMVFRLLALHWQPARVIDPSVVVANSANIGPGTYVAAGSIVSPGVNIGCHVILNFNCTIAHNSIVEDFSQVSPGGRVSGFSVVRTGAFIASNAVVAPKAAVGAWATLGACSFAVSNVPDGATAIGIPARVVFRSKNQISLTSKMPIGEKDLLRQPTAAGPNSIPARPTSETIPKNSRLAEIRATVETTVREVLQNTGRPRAIIEDDGGLFVEIGLDSLDLAEVVVKLEQALGVDPFRQGNIRIRTFADLVRSYHAELEKQS